MALSADELLIPSVKKISLISQGEEAGSGADKQQQEVAMVSCTAVCVCVCNTVTITTDALMQ